MNAAIEAAAELPRVEEGARLSMLEYLQALEVHHHKAWFYLVDGRGYHPNVVWAKAEKANAKNYAGCGVSPRVSWLEEPGREFIKNQS